MKMPNAQNAAVDLGKLRAYCLSPHHPRGRHKAHVFASTLALTADNSGELADALLKAAREGNAKPAERDDYGQRYVIDFRLSGPRGQATVRSIWIIRHDEQVPRFVTCYVL